MVMVYRGLAQSFVRAIDSSMGRLAYLAAFKLEWKKFEALPWEKMCEQRNIHVILNDGATIIPSATHLPLLLLESKALDVLVIQAKKSKAAYGMEATPESMMKRKAIKESKNIQIDAKSVGLAL
ncbi:hypothetical protein RJZ90_001279 [Blastomyces dermatitidis]